jgi:hypothetical protein
MASLGVRDEGEGGRGRRKIVDGDSRRASARLHQQAINVTTNPTGRRNSLSYLPRKR